MVSLFREFEYGTKLNMLEISCNNNDNAHKEEEAALIRYLQANKELFHSTLKG